LKKSRLETVGLKCAQECKIPVLGLPSLRAAGRVVLPDPRLAKEEIDFRLLNKSLGDLGEGDNKAENFCCACGAVVEEETDNDEGALVMANDSAASDETPAVVNWLSFSVLAFELWLAPILQTVCKLICYSQSHRLLFHAD
jgi:hypothetical protein